MKATTHTILLYASWYITVYGAAHDRYLPGVVANVLVALVYLYWKRFIREELIFLFLVTVCGSAIDSLNPILGFVTFKANSVSILNIYPLWMLSLWIAFATAFKDLFKWLEGKLVLAALIGGFAGPLSFSAAQSIGALTFTKGELYPLMINSLEWAVMFPILIFIRSWINTLYLSSSKSIPL